MNICALSVASRIGTRFLQYACALLALFALCICTGAIAADAGDSANTQQTHEHVTSADSDKTQSADTLQTIMVTARQGPRAMLSDKPGFGVELNRALPLHRPYEHG